MTTATSRRGATASPATSFGVMADGPIRAGLSQSPHPASYRSGRSRTTNRRNGPAEPRFWSIRPIPLDGAAAVGSDGAALIRRDPADPPRPTAGAGLARRPPLLRHGPAGPGPVRAGRDRLVRARRGGVGGHPAHQRAARAGQG